MKANRIARVEQAIVRERGLLQATAETRREAFLFLAMLDAAMAITDEWRQAKRMQYETVTCSACGIGRHAADRCFKPECPIA